MGKREKMESNICGFYVSRGRATPYGREAVLRLARRRFLVGHSRKYSSLIQMV